MAEEAIQYKFKRKGKKRVGGKVGNHLDVDIRTQNKGLKTGWRERKTETAHGNYF